jgi:hypothetical protein
MPVIFLFLFMTAAFAFSCKPYEIYIREQWIDAYIKLDGTKVSAHSRDAHCREIERSNYFQDSTNQTFKNIKPKIKRWNAAKKKIVQENLSLLPPWLSKYDLAEILRGDVGGSPKNPAASFVSTRTLMIFDRFFKEKEKVGLLMIISDLYNLRKFLCQILKIQSMKTSQITLRLFTQIKLV